jgi:small subunit ribosomal protein S4
VYLSARFKIDRLVGERISGHPKAPIERGRPGQHGRAMRRKRESEYAVQRNAIRTLSAFYGSDLGCRLKFKKTLRYARESLLSKTNHNAAQAFIERFETRLDTIVYRLKWAPSMRAARQFISHGFVEVDGHRTTRGHIKPGQSISVTKSGAQSQTFKLGQVLGYNQTPSYIESSGTSGKMLRLPAINEIAYPCTINPSQVLKFCRRRL